MKEKPSLRRHKSNRKTGWVTGFSGSGKLLVCAAVAVGAGMVWYFVSDHLTLDSLARRETMLREFHQSQPVLGYLTAFLVYVVATAVSIPGAAVVLTLFFAWFFGFWPALLLVSFASTLGATLAFLFTRFLFRDSLVIAFESRTEHFISSFDREGHFYLFTMRLVPAFPFWMVNVAMGLTSIRTWTYWWVSQLGMLPGTAVYVFAGSRVPDLQTLSKDGPGNLLPFFIALALLGFFPLLARWILKRFGSDVGSL